MPVISMFHGIVIRMYSLDNQHHNLPHLHARYAEFDIRTVTALANFRLQVELTDGRKGVFDLGPYLDQPSLSALRDAAYFEQVSVFYGAATWPGGEDISPATLAAGLLAEQPA